ncbi:unnamed protein product [Clavelina lepadiformis]|uniref:LEM domain-containing protein n=1 Tax=Clavelina lepadiformis TaxID=159417 RepID=A0ABP0GD73_CLALP
MKENALTDADLRRELKMLGQNVGPITSSTRAIYLKKLAKLKEQSKERDKTMSANNDFQRNGNRSGNSSSNSHSMKQTTVTRHTFGFSSDESDNNDDLMKLKRTSSRGRGKQVKQKPTTGTTEKPAHPRVRGLSGRSAQVKRTPNTSPLHITNGYSDDSDEEKLSSSGSWIEVTSVDTSTGTSPHSASKSGTQKMLSRRSLRKQSTCGNVSTAFNFSPGAPGQSSAFNFSTPGSMDNSTAADAIFANSPQNTTSSRNFMLGHGEPANGGSEILRRRVLKRPFTQATISDEETMADEHILQNNAEIKTEQCRQPSKGNIFVRFFSYIRSTRQAENFQVPDSNNSFAPSEQPTSSSWSLHCSMLLPICTIIFFIVLGLLYVTMRSDDAMARRALEYTTEEREANKTMFVVNSIYEVLAKAAGDRVCNYTNAPSILSVDEVKLSVKHDEGYWQKALKMIHEHPEWKLLLYKNEDGMLVEKDDGLYNVQYMESEQPMLPTLCRFYRAVEKVIFRVGIILSGGLCVWLLILCRQYQTRKQEEEKQMMYTLVEKILDVLKNHYESSRNDDEIEPYLPIIHARDTIIPPQERSKKAHAWEKAVQFLSASESRIRVETQRMAGEDFRVWRWIQVISPDRRHQAPGRVWQGEAFDTSRSINTVTVSPTPCLKIRNMFDPESEKDEDWHIQVQDSILEKCADNNEILSIVVEKSSKEGVVYVKCGSCAAAGCAFRALHGSWFDGRLVTVKFIKLQRYHTRYPDTVNCTTPMKPSSKKPVSTFSPPPPVPAAFTTSTPLRS